jgi:chemotaxis protein histidine kinase CheA
MVKDILLRLGIDITGAKEGLQEGTKEFKEYEKSVALAKNKTDGMLDASSQMPGVMGQAATGVKGLIGTVRTLTAALIANPIGLIIAAIAVQVAVLVAIFKDFAPITDFISDKIAYLSGLFKGLRTALFNLVSGFEVSTKAITDQANAMERASQMEREYEDNIDSLNLKQAQYEAQIDKLLKQAKNKSISDKEANDIIKEATRLQAEQINQLKEVSKIETSMLVEKAKGYGATYKQILAIQNGASVESLNNTSNELDAALVELQKNYTKRVEEVGSLESRTEKIKNVSDALEEKRKAKQDKIAADRLKLQEEQKKREEAESKDRADRAKEYDEQQAKQLENDRARTASLNESKREQYAAEIADLKAVAADEVLIEEERLAAIDELNKKGVLSDKEAADAKVKIAEAEANAKIQTLQGYSQLLTQISNLAGRETAAGKALAVAATTIDTYVAAFRAYKEGFKIDPTGTFSLISAAAAAATGIAAVKNILSVKVPNAGGGGGGGSVPSMNLPTTRPSSGFTMLGNEDPLRTTNEGGMVRVFVTESDITTSQNRVSSIQAKATIG